MGKFEEKYSLKSEEFIKKFDNGEMGDDLDFFEWYAYVDSYNRVEKGRGFSWRIYNDLFLFLEIESRSQCFLFSYRI